MKCIVSRESILPALQRAVKLAYARNIPVLACVHLHVETNLLTVTATDMDATYTETIATDTPAGDGVAVLQAKPLLHFVKAAAKGAQIEIEARPVENGEDPSAILRCGRNSATVKGRPVEDWPMPETPTFESFTLPMNVLCDMLAAVKHAISTEQTRYYLNGVYLHRRPEGLTMVATDGHRLAKIATDKAAGDGLARIDGTAGVIIPHAAVTFLCGWLNPKNAWDVIIGISEDRSRVRFEHGAVTLLSKTIDGSFPDYDHVIPTQNNIKVEIATAAAIAFLNGHKWAVKLTCMPGSVALSVTDHDTGDAATEIEASVSAPIEIGFNARYLKAELERCGKGAFATVNLALADAGSPAVLTCRDRPDELHVLMPMRV